MVAIGELDYVLPLPTDIDGNDRGVSASYLFSFELSLFSGRSKEEACASPRLPWTPPGQPCPAVPDDVADSLTGSNRASFNVIGAYDGVFEADDIGNIFGSTDAPLDPGLEPLADNGGPTRTHLLLAGSPRH